MAARFWVAGGTGNWSSTTNWSATTGGASGASVPGSADTATFNASSGAGTATVDSSVTIQTLTMTGFTGTLAFGTNTISLNSTGTVFTGATTFTVTGTPVINVTSTGSTAITVTTTAMTEANAISFNFTGGTYALTFLATASYTAKNVDFTGYAGTWGATSTATIYGNLTLSTGMTLTTSASAMTFGATSGTQTITSNAKTMDFPLTFNGVGGTFQLQDAMIVGATRTTTLTNGTLDLNSKTLTTGLFASSNSNTRVIAFGTGNITCNGAGGNLWGTSTATNLTVTGTPLVNISYSGATATTLQQSQNVSQDNSISFNITAGTYSLNFFGSSSNTGVRNLNFTGFSGTLAAITSPAYLYGDLTFSSGMTTAAVNPLTFASTSATARNITSNRTAALIQFIFNGVGGTWRLADAATTQNMTQTNGTLDLNGKTLTAAAYTTAAGTKDLTFNGGTLVITNATTTAFNNAAPTGYTTTAGTGTGKISMTAATAKTFVGGGSTFNCTLSNDGAGALTISGANTFTNIANGVQPTSFVFPIATTQTVTNWNVSGTAGNLVTITSGTAGVPALLSKASGTVSSNYLSLKDSTATGGATWYAGANSTNVSGNLGWIFSSAPATNTGNFFFMF